MKPERKASVSDLEINKTIHEPARLKIMIYLFLTDFADFVYLMHQTGLTQGNLSSHLSKLEKEELVCITKEFVEKTPRTIISLTEKGRADFNEYRDSVLQLLDLSQM